MCKIIYGLVSFSKFKLTIDMMLRPLSKELRAITLEELHEDPERIEDDIKHIQHWIEQQPHLNAPTDAQWILGFLRGCKSSLQKTKEKLDMYYTLRTSIPEIMKPRDVYAPELQVLLRAGIILPLPYTENHQGPRVILMRYNNYDTRTMNPESFTAVLFMIMNILMVEDDTSIISGLLLWYDISRLPFGYVLQLTPSILNNFFKCLKNAFPFRIKGIHGTGSLLLAEKLLIIMKGYFGAKLRDRVFVYSEDSFENIFKTIPKSYMPKEYGGENSNVEEIKDYWIHKVESYSAWFKESHQYGTIEALRPELPASPDDVIGIDGSFRKLNID